MTLGALISRIVGIYIFVSGLRMAGGVITGGGGSGITLEAWPVFVLPVLFLIAGSVLFARPIRAFDVTLPSGELDLKHLELTAFRIVGLLVVFEAVPLLTGSLISTMFALVSPTPRGFPGGLGDEAFRLRTFIGAGFSALAGILQLWLGLWLLLHPENLKARIERWRAKRQRGYFEEDLSETSIKGEEN